MLSSPSLRKALYMLASGSLTHERRVGSNMKLKLGLCRVYREYCINVDARTAILFHV